MKTKVLVTRDSIKEMLSNSNPAYVQAVIGRALLVVLRNQTSDERINKATSHNNGMGFTRIDARDGTKAAQFYQKYKRLESWMVDRWTREAANGYPRIAKYHKQINAVAKAN